MPEMNLIMKFMSVLLWTPLAILALIVGYLAWNHLHFVGVLIVFLTPVYLLIRLSEYGNRT